MKIKDPCFFQKNTVAITIFSNSPFVSDFGYQLYHILNSYIYLGFVSKLWNKMAYE